MLISRNITENEADGPTLMRWENEESTKLSVFDLHYNLLLWLGAEETPSTWVSVKTKHSFGITKLNESIPHRNIFRCDGYVLKFCSKIKA